MQGCKVKERRVAKGANPPAPFAGGDKRTGIRPGRDSPPIAAGCRPCGLAAAPEAVEDRLQADWQHPPGTQGPPATAFGTAGSAPRKATAPGAPRQAQKRGVPFGTPRFQESITQTFSKTQLLVPWWKTVRFGFLMRLPYFYPIGSDQTLMCCTPVRIMPSGF